MLFDLGSHLIDQALCLLGPVARVYAELDRRRGARPWTTTRSWRSSTGAAPALICGCRRRRRSPGRASGARVARRVREVGARRAGGCARAGARADSAGFGEEPPSGWGVVGAGEDVEPVETEPGRYVAFYEELERAIRTGSPPPVPLEAGVEVLRVIEAAIESAASGTVVGGLECARWSPPPRNLVTLAAHPCAGAPYGPRHGSRGGAGGDRVGGARPARLAVARRAHQLRARDRRALVRRLPRAPAGVRGEERLRRRRPRLRAPMESRAPRSSASTRPTSCTSRGAPAAGRLAALPAPGVRERPRRPRARRPSLGPRRACHGLHPVIRRGARTYIQYWLYYPDSNSAIAGSDKAWEYRHLVPVVGGVLRASRGLSRLPQRRLGVVLRPHRSRRPGLGPRQLARPLAGLQAGELPQQLDRPDGLDAGIAREPRGPHPAALRAPPGGGGGRSPLPSRFAGGRRLRWRHFSQLPGVHIHERTTTAEGLRLIPLETRDHAGYRPLDEDIRPPWRKDAYHDPESDES